MGMYMYTPFFYICIDSANQLAWYQRGISHGVNDAFLEKMMSFAAMEHKRDVEISGLILEPRNQG